MTDLTSYSYAQLIDLRAAVARELEVRKTNEIFAARQKIQSLAKSLGMSVEELVSTKVAHPKAKKQTVYRHPTDETLTWTGHGRKPRWIHKLEAGGATLESLRAPSINEV